MVHNEETIQSIETGPEITEVTESEVTKDWMSPQPEQLAKALLVRRLLTLIFFECLLWKHKETNS